MNLHGIVAPYTRVVSPALACTIRRSVGYDIEDDGTQTPQYRVFAGIQCDFQALSNPDLRKLDALNVQGSNTAIYVNGQLDGAERVNARGGDLITAPDGRVFLVTQVLEDWADWSKVAATLQNGG